MGENDHSLFAGKVQKLEKNVYGSVKGHIRLALVEQDLIDFYEEYSSASLQVFDIGGGSGRFACICARRGHVVRLLDSSHEMIAEAKARAEKLGVSENVTVIQHDFLAESPHSTEKFDLVLLHGSAEWMTSPETAIVRACRHVRPGGCLSLLVFNKDRLTLKHGINGLLLKDKSCNGSKSKNLTPPGAMSPVEIRQILSQFPGRICVQSGIRIFYKFFRKGVSEDVLTEDEWLQQERDYFRQEPFAGLGEHTHFIWQAKL